MRVFIRNSILVLTVLSVIAAVTDAQQCIVLIVSPSTTNFTGLNAAITNFQNASSVFDLYKTTLPYGTAYMYRGYENFIYNNIYASNAANYVQNASLYINFVLTNFTAAAANTSSLSTFTSLNNSINTALTYFNSPNGNMPQFVYSNMTDLMQQIINQLTILRQTISQAQILNIQNTSTSAILAYFSGNSSMTYLVNNFTAISTAFKANATNTFTHMNNTFNLLKSGDPNMVLIEAQYNTTNASLYTSMSSQINNIKTNFTSSINSMVTTGVNVLNSFSVAIKNDSSANSSLPSINETIYQLVSQTNDFVGYINQILQGLVMQQSNQMNSFSYMLTFGYTFNYRQLMFNKLMSNSSLYSCGDSYIKNATALFIKNGGATTMFNCSSVDSAMYTRMNTTLALGLQLLQTEFTYMMAELAGCPNLTPISYQFWNSYAYTVADCLQMTSSFLTNLRSIFSTISSALTMLVQQLSSAKGQKEQVCFYKSLRILISQYGPFYVAFDNCTNTRSNSIQPPSSMALPGFELAPNGVDVSTPDINGQNLQ